MKLKDVHKDVERYFEEDCYCPNEVYSIDGFFFQHVYADADCKIVGEYKDRRYPEENVTFVVTASGSKHDNPILLNIWHTDEKVLGMQQYAYSKENLINISKFLNGDIDSFNLTEEDDIKRSVNEILSMADAILVSRGETNE